jgi:FkbM family methyltransferase
MKILYSLLRPIAERYPWVAKLYRDFRSGKKLVKTPKMTPNGFLFIGNSQMESGQFEPEETVAIKKLLDNADVFIDIGANIGYYCCMALQQNIPTLAFEPINLNLQYLYKNIAANGWENNIEVFPVALGKKSRLIQIYGGGTSASLIKGWSNTPEYYCNWVPVSTLDVTVGSRLEGKRCLVLVDVEGAELMMLKGASVFLEMTPKPVWIMEITVTQHLPKDVHVNPNLLETFELFWEHGYQAWTCNSNPRLIEKEEIMQIAETEKNTLGTHNFIFSPVDVPV